MTTHLPSYLDICGMDLMCWSAKALGVIGGFNVLGSIFFGWAFMDVNKLLLLGCIYTIRSLALTWYFSSALSPASTLVFAAVMGSRLGAAPLVAGWIGEIFSAWCRGRPCSAGWFFSHQIGSFVGAFGGGLVYDAGVLHAGLAGRWDSGLMQDSRRLRCCGDAAPAAGTGDAIGPQCDFRGRELVFLGELQGAAP
ncbi:hypothetical protein ACTMU2_40155 [Cupriavidus basilensis]